MKNGFLVAIVFLASSVPSLGADSLAFSRRGARVAEHDRKALEALSPLETVKVFEFHENRERSYQAIDLKKVFDRVFGPDWRKEDDVVFRCSDGYEPVIPVGDLVRHAVYFAVDAADGAPFEFAPKPPKPGPIRYGGFYLVWKNLGDEALLSEGDRNWPYQVVSVDLVRFADRYPKLAPPARSAKAIREGFALYRTHCVNCHTLNGEGGSASGIELNRPVSVTRYWRREWLLRWIEHPAKVRESAKMPPYMTSTTHALPKVEERRQIEKIVRYLEAMAR
jgi:mono/diheme cytochrome c family protein